MFRIIKGIDKLDSVVLFDNLNMFKIIIKIWKDKDFKYEER